MPPSRSVIYVLDGASDRVIAKIIVANWKI